jgi:hypothetical protein
VSGVSTLTTANVIPVFQAGQADLVALFALRHVTTGDTIDLATITSFQNIKQAVVMGVSAFVEIAATFTGTTVTMPGGLSGDSAYLLAWGC